MRSNRNFRQSKRWVGWPIAAAAIGTFLFVGTAAPAHADSNFSRGFEDQVGRILAYEAVNLGKHVLFQGVVAPYQSGHHGSNYGHDNHRSNYRNERFHRTNYRSPRHDRWRGHDNDRDDYRDRRHDRRHRWSKRHDRHHRHDRHCGHH